jgi:hypothetical protein
VRQKEFGLASLFGVSYARKIEGPMLNSYLSVNKESSGRFHPIVKDLENSVRFINAVNQVSVTAKEEGPFPLQVVPTYPDLPMEEVFPPKDALHGQPGVIVRQIGKGRVVYFPGDIDRTFWETLNYDRGRLLRNAVLWATDEAAPVTIEGHGVIDVSVWEQKSSMTVHMVNLTNPMMMKGPVREIIPIGAQELTVRVPEGRSVRRVRLLVAETEADYATRKGELSLKVPSIAVHEVAAIDFA